MKLTFDRDKLFAGDEPREDSVHVFDGLASPAYQIVPNVSGSSTLLSGSSFTEELEDYLDLICARQALSESDERIPYEIVREDLGLTD